MIGILRKYRFGAVMSALFACEIAASAYTGHVFDVGAFLNTADRAFFAGVSPASWWAFGAVSLMIICGSQLPMLIVSGGVRLGLRLSLLKLPFILADFASSLLLARAARRGGVSRIVACGYLLLPAVSYTSVFHGTFDALANLTMTAAILALTAGRPGLCGVLLGIGGGTKYYPAFFLPAALYFAWRAGGVGSAARLALTCAGALLLTVAPIHLLNHFGGSAIVENTVGVNASVPISPWSLYYPCATQIPASLRLALAAGAALFPTLALVALHRSKANVAAPLTIARFFAVTTLGVVVLNPGSTPQFYSWIAGPCVLYAIASRTFAPIAVAAVGGALAVLLEIATEGFDTFVRIAFALRADAPFTPSSNEQMILATALVATNLALFGALLRGADENRRGLSANVRAACAVAVAFACTLGLGVAAVVQFRERAVPPMLADFFNRDALDTLALAPSAKTGTPKSCTMTYDAARYDILQNPRTLRYVDLKLYVGDGPPNATRVAGVRFDRAAWRADARWINDLALIAHPAHYSLVVPARVLARGGSVRVAMSPCGPNGGDLLVAHLDMRAAIASRFSGTASGE